MITCLTSGTHYTDKEHISSCSSGKEQISRQRTYLPGKEQIF